MTEAPTSQAILVGLLHIQSSIFWYLRTYHIWIANTRGLQTATPTLIKVNEIGQNLPKYYYFAKIFKTDAFFWEKAHRVCSVAKSATEKVPLFSHVTDRWSHVPKWNPIKLTCKDPLSLPRYQLSVLVHWIESYMATTKAWQTQYFLFALIY